MPAEYILGLDIGGANTKYILVEFDPGVFRDKFNESDVPEYSDIIAYKRTLLSGSEYFPFWEKSLGDFEALLKKIDKRAADATAARKFTVVVTITAELSDVFRTKKEGIEFICKSLCSVFPSEDIKIINAEGDFIGPDEAISEYMSVAASNWVATSYVLGENIYRGFVLDMGSTTLDIIPIYNGRPVAVGKTDIDRLLNYELFYTGILRPPVSTVVQHVPFRNVMCPISFERFALMADVNMILGNITEDQYTCDTADGRGKSLEECYERLSRIVCGDIDTVFKKELDEIAVYIYNSQKKMVRDAIKRAVDQYLHRFVTSPLRLMFYITGSGAFLLREVLTEDNYDEKQIIYSGLDEREEPISSVVCLVIYYIGYLIGKKI